MIMPDAKKKATMIVAAMKPSPAPEMPEESHDDMGYESAAEEILQAVESKDAKALSEALKSFHDMCAAADEESSEPQDNPAEESAE
jgi:hypothetical protein